MQNVKTEIHQESPKDFNDRLEAVNIFYPELKTIPAEHRESVKQLLLAAVDYIDRQNASDALAR